MCIIAAKPAGVNMPDDRIMENMWNRNNDGAGFMYAVNGSVYIEKGFMKYKDLKTRLDQLGRKYNLRKLPMVMHFRITTHGGTKPENCHPFPISDSIGMLKKLKLTTSIGVAHNGIIPISPRKDISDTMEYIASQIAPLYKAVPMFYKNKNLMQMIANAIDSKMAFLTDDGKIYTIGDFAEDKGIKYSNRSFEKTTAWRDYTWGCYNMDSWEMYEGMGHYSYKPVMWLDEAKGEFILTEDDQMRCEDYAIDEDGNVYEYDYMEDALVKINAEAFNAEGFKLKFDENSKMCTEEVIFASEGNVRI